MSKCLLADAFKDFSFIYFHPKVQKNGIKNYTNDDKRLLIKDY